MDHLRNSKRRRSATPPPTRAPKRPREDDNDEKEITPPPKRVGFEEPLENLEQGAVSPPAGRRRLSPSAPRRRRGGGSVNTKPSNLPTLRLSPPSLGTSPTCVSPLIEDTNKLSSKWEPRAAVNKIQGCSKEKHTVDKVGHRPDDGKPGQNHGKKSLQVPPRQQRKNTNSSKSLTETPRPDLERKASDSSTVPGPKRKASLAGPDEDSTMKKREGSEDASPRRCKIRRLNSSADMEREDRLGEVQLANETIPVPPVDLGIEKQNHGDAALNQKLRLACSSDLPEEDLELSGSGTTSTLGSSLSKTNANTPTGDTSPASVPDTSMDFALAQQLAAEFEAQCCSSTSNVPPLLAYDTTSNSAPDTSEDEHLEEEHADDCNAGYDDDDDDGLFPPEMVISAQTTMLRIVELCNEHPRPSSAVCAELRTALDRLPDLLINGDYGDETAAIFTIEVWQHPDLARWDGPECLRTLGRMLGEMEMFGHLAEKEPRISKDSFSV